MFFKMKESAFFLWDMAAKFGKEQGARYNMMLISASEFL